jgi:hypothetical protein
MQSAISRVIIIDSYCSGALLADDRNNTGKMLEGLLSIELNQAT